MLKQTTIDRLASLAKVKSDELLAAIKSDEEVDFAVSEKINSFTEDELVTLKNNEYKSGKTKGVEMEIKEARDKHGLEFQGKTIDGMLEAYSKKVLADAKIEPEKKVLELNEKITTLQNTVRESEAKLAEKEKEVASVKVNGELYKHIPSMGDDGPALGADDVIQLMKVSGYDFQLEEGKTVVFKDGKKVVNNLSENLPPKDVINSFLKEKKLFKEEQVPGGRGNGDGKPPIKHTKMSDIKKEFEAAGKSLLGSEFSEAVTKAAAENKDFDMKS